MRTSASAGKLYRGVRVQLDPSLLAKLGDATEVEEVGRELELGPIVLDQLAAYGGLGTHWSTRPEIAERFALDSSSRSTWGVGVLITADWNGQGEDHDRTGTGGTWADEAEVTLLPGTSLTITSVVIGSSFADGVEILHTNKYQGHASAFADHGLPIPTGAPQTRTASAGKLYRGYWINLLDPRVPEDFYGYVELDIHDNPQMVANNILDWIANGGERNTGTLGGYWSRSKQVADWFANRQGKGGSDLGRIVIAADWNGEGEEQPHWHWDKRPEEDQVMLRSGTPIAVTDMWVNDIHVPIFRSVTARTASDSCDYCSSSATQKIIHSEGMGYIPVCDKHLSYGKDDAAACVPSGDPDPGNIDRIEKVAATRTASDFDDILELLGPSIGPGDPYVAPENTHPGIDGVPRGWERYVEDMLAAPDRTGYADLWMPTSAVAHYAEYARDGEQLEAVMYAIRQRGGIWSPVDISTDGSTALLHEGNHRLVAAQRLGITEIPVRVSVDPVVRANEGTPVPLEPFLRNWLRQTGVVSLRTAKRLYHRTTPEAAEAIYNSGRMTSKEYDGSVFFSTERDGQGEGYGTAVVVLEVPEDRLDDIGWMDDEFPDGEEHWALDSRQLDPSWFVRTAGTRIARPVGIVAAVPGGVLPYQPSDFGYRWEEHDGDAVAVTRDGIAEMVLTELPGGQIGWSVYDDEGLVERGNFSGMYTEDPQGIYWRADRLLSEFDSNPIMPSKSFEYDDAYTETFPTSFPKVDFMGP